MGLQIEFEAEGTLTSISSRVSLLLEKGCKSILVLGCDTNSAWTESINHYLHSMTVPVLGGVFPGIIQQDKHYTKGTLLIGIDTPVQTIVIPDLSSGGTDFEGAFDPILSKHLDINTAFVFIDGFAKKISGVIESLFTIFGLEFNFLGGGSGSLLHKDMPSVITNRGLLCDAVVVGFSGLLSSVGVAHGWQQIDGPFRVTESHDNVVQTLDWEPAFDVYKQAVERFYPGELKPEHFYDVAMAFPLGITKIGAENLVRDPLAIGEEHSLVFVGEVPQHVFVHLLKGEMNLLTQAARSARDTAISDFPEKGTIEALFFIDCISRVLYMGERFNEELDAVFNGAYPMFGALTIGEIANSKKEYLEFYNKTSVFGVLGTQ